MITDTDSPKEHTGSFKSILGSEMQRCSSQMSTVPVRMDWSTLRVVDLIDVILISAGTLSPTRKQNGFRVISSKGRQRHYYITDECKTGRKQCVAHMPEGS